MNKKIIIGSLILTSTLSFALDINSIGKSVVDNISKSSQNTQANSKNIDTNIANSGIKEALKIGVDYAVKSLGAKNGYLDNSLVKIPLPTNLAKVETLLRKAGGDKIANNLINSMNSAASQAAPKTAEIFVNAINNMSLADAQKILSGGNNAATDYFKANTTSSLKKLISPIITKSMEANQVAKYYDAANSFYKTNLSGMVKNSSVGNMAKNLGLSSYIPGASDESINDYVSNKAIDGLFKMIATKEADIRTNPVEQTTSLLKKVFGK